MNYLKKFNEWLNSRYIDDETKNELNNIRNNLAEIKERFYTELEFGTGGLRGILGAGTNRMNKYIVRKTTQGIANYIKKMGKNAKQRGVVIGYDSRICSYEFAEETAFVLNANGIKTYIFERLTPTPLVSFAVRKLKTIAGIVITASHNPPSYNGYKVYWEDGGQIVPQIAESLIKEIKCITDFKNIKIFSKQKSIESKLFNIIDKKLLYDYIKKIKDISLAGKEIIPFIKKLKIIYTPIHGSGNIPVRTILKEKGFKNIFIVKEQELPDGKFPTVKSPNPEEKEVFNLALKYAEKINPDIIIGTDPDCDRIGVVVKNNKAKYLNLTGNQVGVLLAEYILSRMKLKQKLSSKSVIIKTIVTTDMIKAICDKYNVKLIETLTGFKFIGEKIKEFEYTDEYKFVFGLEESYGYLTGTFVRDKDAVIAAAMICEMAAYYKSKNITLYEQLLKLMAEYGYYLEDLLSINLEGNEGKKRISNLMNYLRKTKITAVGKNKVVSIEDYLNLKKFDMISNKIEYLSFPESDVLKFSLDNKWSFAVRPSGTEPKLKIYLFVRGKNYMEAKKNLRELKNSVSELIHSV